MDATTSTVDLRPDCDRASMQRGELVAIPCGRKADVHILGASDARAMSYDRCRTHKGEAMRYIVQQPGGHIVRVVPA
jgi:hypothetical protein